MFVKKYEAGSLEKALEAVREELGPDALILSTEKKKSGVFQRSSFYVTAAYEKPPEEQPFEESPKDDLREVFRHRSREEGVSQAVRRKTSKKAIGAYQGSQAPVAPLQTPAKVSQEFRRLEEVFVERGFTPAGATNLARQLLFEYGEEELSNDRVFRRAVQSTLLPGLRTLSLEALQQEPVIGLIGLPGVGKTMAAIKLAMRLEQMGTKTKLIHHGDYKLLGQFELAAYSELTGIPFGTQMDVSHPDGGVQILDGFIPPRTEVENKQLKDRVATMGFVLVLDANMRTREMLSLKEQCEGLPIKGVVFSRADVLVEWGPVFEFLRKTSLPVLGMIESRSFEAPFRGLSPADLIDRFLDTKNASRPAERGIE